MCKDCLLTKNKLFERTTGPDGGQAHRGSLISISGFIRQMVVDGLCCDSYREKANFKIG